MFPFTPNITNWTGSVESVGPTGPTGSTGPLSNFSNQGFSVGLGSDTVILSNDFLIRFDTVFSSLGQYNDGGMYSLITGLGIITQDGIYEVNAVIDYSHNFNVSNEIIICRIYRNLTNILCQSHLFYPSTHNDNSSVTLSNTVKLLAGDTVSVRITTDYDGSGNQIVGILSTFSCQRIS